MEISTLIIPSFIAGLFTFLAPCTFPLIPGYLGFISGTTHSDISNPTTVIHVRKKILLSGLFYVFGFSSVFILLGMLFGLGGSIFGQYRSLLSQIGGAFVLFFGLYLLGFFTSPAFSFLHANHTFGVSKALTPGKPLSSFIFGTTFAFGWTPCVGPILGSILTLAAQRATVFQGGLLLSVFSLGLAIPFLLIAVGIGSAGTYIKRINKYLHVIEKVGGGLLIIIGILLLTNTFDQWISFFYRLDIFDFNWIATYL